MKTIGAIPKDLDNDLKVVVDLKELSEAVEEVFSEIDEAKSKEKEPIREVKPKVKKKK